jgi:phage gp29-like protein
MTLRERQIRLAETLPVAHWLTQFSVREVETRLRRYGLPQKVAKTAISAAKKKIDQTGN